MIGVDAELDDVPALRRRLPARCGRSGSWPCGWSGRPRSRREKPQSTRTHEHSERWWRRTQRWRPVTLRSCAVARSWCCWTAREAQAAEIAAADAVQALGRRRELATAEDQLHRLHEHAADARLAYDLAVADHMTATAPRLAEQLRDGEPCSVCGSRDHPAPALAAASARLPEVSIQDVDARRAAAEAASTAPSAIGSSVVAHFVGLPCSPIDRRPDGGSRSGGRTRSATAAAARQASLAVALVELDERRASVTIDEQRAAHTAATRAAELWPRSLRWHESRSFWPTSVPRTSIRPGGSVSSRRPRRALDERDHHRG